MTQPTIGNSVNPLIVDISAIDLTDVPNASPADLTNVPNLDPVLFAQVNQVNTDLLPDVAERVQHVVELPAPPSAPTSRAGSPVLENVTDATNDPFIALDPIRQRREAHDQALADLDALILSSAQPQTAVLIPGPVEQQAVITEELPATEVPASTEVPAAEVPASTEVPAAEVPVSTEVPAASTEQTTSAQQPTVPAKKASLRTRIGNALQVALAKIKSTFASKPKPTQETTPATVVAQKAQGRFDILLRTAKENLLAERVGEKKGLKRLFGRISYASSVFADGVRGVFGKSEFQKADATLRVFIKAAATYSDAIAARNTSEKLGEFVDSRITTPAQDNKTLICEAKRKLFYTAFANRIAALKSFGVDENTKLAREAFDFVANLHERSTRKEFHVLNVGSLDGRPAVGDRNHVLENKSFADEILNIKMRTEQSLFLDEIYNAQTKAYGSTPLKDVTPNGFNQRSNILSGNLRKELSKVQNDMAVAVRTFHGDTAIVSCIEELQNEQSPLWKNARNSAEARLTEERTSLNANLAGLEQAIAAAAAEFEVSEADVQRKLTAFEAEHDTLAFNGLSDDGIDRARQALRITFNPQRVDIVESLRAQLGQAMDTYDAKRTALEALRTQQRSAVEACEANTNNSTEEGIKAIINHGFRPQIRLLEAILQAPVTAVAAPANTYISNVLTPALAAPVAAAQDVIVRPVAVEAPADLLTAPVAVEALAVEDVSSEPLFQLEGASTAPALTGFFEETLIPSLI